MRKFAEKSKQPLDNMTNSWTWSRNGNKAVWHLKLSSGLAKTILQGARKKEGLVGRRRDGKPLLRNGQERTLLAQLGQLKIGQDGNRLL